MRRFLAPGALLVAILVGVVLLAFHLHRDAREKILSQFNKHQLLVAQLTAAQIEWYFNGRSRDALYISSLPSVRRRDMKTMPSDLRPYLARLSRAHIREVAVLDEDGKVLCSTAGGASGSDEARSAFRAWRAKPGNEGTARLIVEKRDARSASGAGSHPGASFPRVSVVAPVVREAAAGGVSGSRGTFAGAVVLAVDLEKMLAERVLLSTPVKVLRDIWIIDSGGVLLLQSEHPEMVSSNVRDLSGNCIRCHGSFNYIDKIVSAKQGAVEYRVKGFPTKVAVFSPMTFGDVSWIVVVNVPYDEVTGFVANNLRDTLGLLGIVALAVGVTLHIFYRSHRQKSAIEEEVAHLKEKEGLAERLRETRDYLENLLDYANAPIIVWDPDFRITRVNRAFGRLTGRRVEELLGNPLDTLFPEDRREESMAHIRRTMAGERWETVEIPILRADGAVRTVLWNSATLYAGDGRTVVATIAQGQDITERKEAESALQASESKYRLLIENASEAIFIVQDGIVTFSNPAMTRFTGYSRNELASMPFLALVHPDDRPSVDERQERCLRGEEVPDVRSFRFRTKAGKELWGELNAAPIRWEGRRAILNFVRDITLQKRLESQLSAAQKMEAVGKLAGGVAHDFNNLLTVILGYCDILSARLQAGDGSHREIEAIQKAGTRARALTSQLLAFSRKQVLQPRVISVNSVVRETEAMLRRLIKEDIEIIVELNDAPWNVKADPGQIEQVLMNIAINARDAMPDGGKLTIETSNILLEEDRAAGQFSLPSGAYVVVAVSDTGVGMDKETASKIFEPFFTTKERGKGTGLGLATAYGIVKQSGGFISVYSEPGRGSTFKVYLPRTEDRTEEPRKEAPADEDLRGDKVVLVAEDDAAIRRLAVDILAQYGYTVLAADDGEEALRIAAEHRGEIALLLTDVVMPRIGGRELYERIRQLRPRIRVLYVSGYTDNAIVHHGVLDAGIAFLQKPYTPVSLARKLKEVLESRG